MTKKFISQPRIHEITFDDAEIKEAMFDYLAKHNISIPTGACIFEDGQGYQTPTLTLTITEP
jgi:hypothetical protein